MVGRIRKYSYGVMSPFRVAHDDRSRYDGSVPPTRRDHRRNRRACKRARVARTLVLVGPWRGCPLPARSCQRPSGPRGGAPGGGPACLRPPAAQRRRRRWRRRRSCPLAVVVDAAPCRAVGVQRQSPIRRRWLCNAPGGAEESLLPAVTPCLNQLRLHAIGRGDSEQFSPKGDPHRHPRARRGGVPIGHRSARQESRRADLRAHDDFEGSFSAGESGAGEAVDRGQPPTGWCAATGFVPSRSKHGSARTASVRARFIISHVQGGRAR